MSTPNLSRVFVEHSISTAAAREIMIAVNVEIAAMAARVAELEQQLGNKQDKVDRSTRA